MPAQRAQEPLRAAALPAPDLDHASRPGAVVHPAELGEHRGQGVGVVREPVGGELAAGGFGRERQRRSRVCATQGRRSTGVVVGVAVAVAVSGDASRGVPGVGIRASPHGFHGPRASARPGASLDAEDGPPPSSVARDDDARTPLAGVGPVSSGGAHSRVRFTGEPAAPDADPRRSPRGHAATVGPRAARGARPSETRDGRSRSSSSRGWRPSPADAPLSSSARAGATRRFHSGESRAHLGHRGGIRRDSTSTRGGRTRGRVPRPSRGPGRRRRNVLRLVTWHPTWIDVGFRGGNIGFVFFGYEQRCRIRPDSHEKGRRKVRGSTLAHLHAVSGRKC